MAGSRKECEARFRAFIEEMEAEFMPHDITTVMEMICLERESEEWFAPDTPLYVVKNPQ